MLKTETIFSQGIAPSNHFFRQQCLQKSFPISGPKSYISLEIGSPSYFFFFKLLIKDNSIAKTFIKQPLSKLFRHIFYRNLFHQFMFLCVISCPSSQHSFFFTLCSTLFLFEKCVKNVNQSISL